MFRMNRSRIVSPGPGVEDGTRAGKVSVRPHWRRADNVRNATRAQSRLPVQASGRAERLIIQFEKIGHLWHAARLNEMNVVRVMVVALICANGGWFRRLFGIHSMRSECMMSGMDLCSDFGQTR